jgi:hypothetical protein
MMMTLCCQATVHSEVTDTYTYMSRGSTDDGKVALAGMQLGVHLCCDTLPVGACPHACILLLD